jgi:hypothetical protein
MSNTINEQKVSSDYPQEITSYKPIRIIGRGSFGSLYEGIILTGAHKGEHVAVKQVKIDLLNEKKYLNFKVRFIHNILY